MNIFSMMQQFQQNPMAMLQQRFNIPSGMTTPDEIVKHLVDTGQVTQQQVNQVMNMKNMMRK
jgi:hypothetical protein